VTVIAPRPEPEPVPEPAVEVESEPEPSEPEPAPAAAIEPDGAAPKRPRLEPLRPRPRRRWFRRADRDLPEEEPPEPELPKHVRLLPPSEHAGRRVDEVAELFDSDREEHGRR
jgi:hypothetical protein